MYFPRGSTWDKWAYFRRESGPAAQISPTPAVTVAATENVGDDGTGSNNPSRFMPTGAMEEIVERVLFQVIYLQESLYPGLQYGMLSAFVIVTLYFLIP